MATHVYNKIGDLFCYSIDNYYICMHILSPFQKMGSDADFKVSLMIPLLLDPSPFGTPLLPQNNVTFCKDLSGLPSATIR